MIPGVLLKAEATGNDFLVGMGTWANRLAEDAGLVARLCRRRFGIGADGALALFPEGPSVVRLVYRNADGSPASFCANGTRCAALAAVRFLAMAERLSVRTGREMIPARVEGGQVVLELGPPEEPPRPVTLDVAGRRWAGQLVRVGVPHLVLPVKDVASIDVSRVAPRLRGQAVLGQGGANVHFAAPDGSRRIVVRSFERGVEAETLSCGSGVVAAALVTLTGMGGDVLEVRTRGGMLRVEALGEPPECPVRLSGPVRIVAAVDPDP